MQALMKYYDTDGDGSINYAEFARGLQEELPPRRRKVVEDAFTTLDRDRSGFITTSDLASTYDVSCDPAFIDGRKTKEEILREFLSNFDTSKDGAISKDEFLDYYRDISMTVPGDEPFEQLVQQTWQL